MPNTKSKSAGRAMSAQHKAALAKGREEGLAVRRYLEALESSITKKLASIEAELSGADPLTKLHLLQQKKDLQDELGKSGDAQDISTLEKQFVKVAKSYGQRKGIGYGTWRTAGVSAATLQKAGIARTRG